MSINQAPIKWAQRSDSLYITISLSDVTNPTISLTDTELHFKGSSEGKDYEVNIVFFEEVNAEGSTYNVLTRSVHFHILKKAKKGIDDDSSFWPRLMKDKALEKNQVKIDWDRYVDEDEEEEGFDMSAMEGGMGFGGGGGGGGMGGMDMDSLMKQMGGMGDLGAKMKEMEENGELDDLDDDDDDDEDLDDLPELEANS